METITEHQSLVMWTIYQNPKDYPGQTVARKWISQDNRVLPTDVVITGSDLHGLRKRFESMGLCSVERSRHDDPCIVEAWL